MKNILFILLIFPLLCKAQEPKYNSTAFFVLDSNAHNWINWIVRGNFNKTHFKRFSLLERINDTAGKTICSVTYKLDEITDYPPSIAIWKIKGEEREIIRNLLIYLEYNEEYRTSKERYYEDNTYKLLETEMELIRYKTMHESDSIIINELLKK